MTQMPQPLASIDWPAIIRYAGQAELAFVADQAAWNSDPDLHGARYEPDDVLIDSGGAIHSLPSFAQGLPQPVSTGRQAALEEVIELVRAHAAQAGACCVAKFHAASIREAVRAVGDFD